MNQWTVVLLQSEELDSRSMNNIIGMVAVLLPFISNYIFARALLKVFNVRWGFWMVVSHTAFWIRAVVSAWKKNPVIGLQVAFSDQYWNAVTLSFSFFLSTGSVAANERSLWKFLKTCEIGWLWSRYSALDWRILTKYGT
jgi:hypothetical protein